MADVFSIAPWMLPQSREKSEGELSAERTRFNEDALGAFLYTQLKNDATQAGAAPGQAEMFAVTHAGPMANAFARHTLESISLAQQQRLQNIRLQNDIRTNEGLAAFADAASKVDFSNPSDLGKVLAIGKQHPIIVGTPGWNNVIGLFDKAARIDLGYERLQTQWDVASERFKTMSDLQKSRLDNALKVAKVRGIPKEVAIVGHLRDMKNERDVAIFNADFDKADELQEDIDLVLQNAKANSTVTQRDWEFYNTLKSESETSADAFLRMKYGGRLPGDKLEAFGQSERKRLKNQIARVEIGVTKAMGREKREQMALLEQYRQELKNLEDAIARPTPTPAPKLPPVPTNVDVGPPAPVAVAPTAPEGFTEMVNPQGQLVRVPNSRVDEARSKGYQ